MPYLRDTRRSIGIDNFLISEDDLSGKFPDKTTGTVFEDRIAIGNYNVDIHPIKNCTYPG